jgi:DNA-directed RNA polymerase specialized sigma24 family protein
MLRMLDSSEDHLSESTDPEDEYHPAHQAIAAFDALSRVEFRNLNRVAKLFAARGNLASPDELINEAYIRISKDKRRWPRGQEFLSFLGGTVRSLATDKMFARDAKKGRSLKQPLLAVSDEERPNVADNKDPDEAWNKQLQEEIITALEAHFQDDEEMQLFMMGLFDGLRGKPLEEFVGVDTKRLEALRTRYNRQVAKIAAGVRVREGLPA